MKIGEILVVDEFIMDKAYEIIDMLKDNADTITGMGIEAYYNSFNPDSNIGELLQCIRSIINTGYDQNNDLKVSVVVVYGEGIEEGNYRIEVKFFDNEYTFATPIFS